MTDAEAKYEAEEASNNLTRSLVMIRAFLDGVDQVPFGEVSNSLNEAMCALNDADDFHAQVKAALSKIKVRESA